MNHQPVIPICNQATKAGRAARRLAVAAAAVVVACGIGAGSATAQTAPGDSAPEPTLPSSDELQPGTPVPDDSGVVHSWALAPGDGTAQAGDRPNLAYELSPGGSVDDVVTLYNFSNVPLTFGLYATDAFNNDDGTFNLLAADELPRDVGTWVTMPIDSVTVPAGKQATFPISIRVPMDATPGDHVGAILASSTAVGTSPDNAIVTLDRRTGTRLYVRVAGPLRSELAVEDLHSAYAANPNPLDGTATVSYRIVNRGNVVLGGTQSVSVAGPFGLFRTSLASSEVPELLPGESIEVTQEIQSVPATGLMSAEVTIDPRSAAGVDELEPATRSSTTRAVPYLILALVLLFIIAGFARRAYKRHRNETAVINDDGEVVVVPIEVIDVTEHQHAGR